jgi:putative transposase
MSHSHVSALFHCVFSTKERRPLLLPDLSRRLWPYIGGIARENKLRALAVGGVQDVTSSTVGFFLAFQRSGV